MNYPEIPDGSHFPKSEPSISGSDLERKKEPADTQLSRTAEAEWSKLLLTLWHRRRGLNPHGGSQSPVCCHYTTSVYMLNRNCTGAGRTVRLLRAARYIFTQGEIHYGIPHQPPRNTRRLKLEPRVVYSFALSASAASHA